jgi:O-antigen/teichoic acid export membrane protein
MSLARKGGGVFLANWTVLPLQFLTGVLVVRVLGAGDKGVLTIVSTTVAVLSMVGHLSVPAAAIYFLRRGRYDGRTLVASHLMVVAAATASFGVLASLGHRWFSETLLHGVHLSLPVLFAGLAAIPFTMVTTFVGVLLLAMGEARAYARLTIAGGILSLGGTAVALLATDWGLAGAIVAATGVQVATALWGLAVIWRRTAGTAARLEWAVVRDLVGFGLRQHAGSVGSQMFKRVDTYLVAYFLNAGAVGHYSIASLAHEGLLSIPRALAHLLSGEVAGQSATKAAALAAQAARTLLWVLLGVSLVIAIPAPWVVPLIYGADFTAAVAPLLILLPAAVLVGYTMCLQAFFLGIGRPGLNGVFTLTAGAVNLALSIWLIPRLGIVGNALATAVGAVVLFALYLEGFRRSTRLPLQAAWRLRGDEIRSWGRRVLSRSGSV